MTGPDTTSVDTGPKLADSSQSVRYSSEPDYDGDQTQEDRNNTVTSPPSYMYNELKRKGKLDTAADINRELNVRKKIKVSVVPAVNLYE